MRCVKSDIPHCDKESRKKIREHGVPAREGCAVLNIMADATGDQKD